VYGKGIDEILMRSDTTANSGQPFYYQQNHEGSVTHLTDASGTVIEKYRYDVFGAPTAYDGNGNVLTGTAYNNRFLFTGREYRWAYGFYEYRARAYHPTVGRFMSEDPKLFDAGDYNLFRYFDNDPVDRTDPLGLLQHWEFPQMSEVTGSHIPVSAQNLLAAREAVGLSTTLARSAMSSAEGVVMASLRQMSKANGKTNGAPPLDQQALSEGATHVKKSGEEASHTGKPIGYDIYRMEDG
jgi:RHS repeat-associated protein